MAIRNAKLGGTDFADGEVLYDYDLDDTNNKIIDIIGIGHAQNAYQSLQSNNIFENKDFLAVDEFIDVNGTNNTVNTTLSITNRTSPTGNTTTGGVGGGSIATWVDLPNIIDINDSTYAEEIQTNPSYVTDLYTVTRTFTTPTFVDHMKIKADHINTATDYSSQEYNYMKVEYYDGSSWNTIYENTATYANGGTHSVDNFYNINDTVEQVRFNFDMSFESGSGSGTNRTMRIFSMDIGDNTSPTNAVYSASEYSCRQLNGNYTNSTVTADSNIKLLNGNENSICIYTDKNLPTNTSITVDISDGTTTLSAQPVNSVINITSLGSGNLELVFNLTTTDTGVTPTLKGYGVFIK